MQLAGLIGRVVCSIFELGSGPGGHPPLTVERTTRPCNRISSIELTHRALYDWLPAGYAALPDMLNEGLDMTFEMRPDPLRAPRD